MCWNGGFGSSGGDDFAPAKLRNWRFKMRILYGLRKRLKYALKYPARAAMRCGSAANSGAWTSRSFDPKLHVLTI
jgi:hypothetical protein